MNKYSKKNTGFYLTVILFKGYDFTFLIECRHWRFIKCDVVDAISFIIICR